MTWEQAIRQALRLAWRNPDGRFLVYGRKFHDPAGLLPDEWIYDIRCTGRR